MKIAEFQVGNRVVWEAPDGNTYHGIWRMILIGMVIAVAVSLWWSGAWRLIYR